MNNWRQVLDWLYKNFQKKATAAGYKPLNQNLV